MKQLKKIYKTDGSGNEYLVDNPDYTKRAKPTNLRPKKKKRKK